jgi:aryl-alcohol dehydrogenase-like predicted oxidoreductase
MKNWILGSAQFGFHYGITNQAGITELAEMKRTLLSAVNNGANYIDTAAGYGLAEERIGELQTELCVITKLSIQHELTLTQQLSASLKKLKRDSVDLVLIHDVDNFLVDADYQKNLASLDKLKKLGLCRLTGFSIYNVEQAQRITRLIKPDVLQIPLNIWNQEFLLSGELQRLKSLGIEVHARSLFLQGVLLAQSLPEGVDFMIEEFSSWLKFLDEKKISATSACRSFAEQQKEIDAWVIGFENKQQLEAFFAADLIKCDWQKLACNNPSLVDPSQWNKLKQSQ